jgi:hypothetical protein
MIVKIRPVLFVSLFLLGGGVPAQAQTNCWWDAGAGVYRCPQAGVPTGQGPLTYPVPPATSTTAPRRQQRTTNPSPNPFGTR